MKRGRTVRRLIAASPLLLLLSCALYDFDEFDLSRRGIAELEGGMADAVVVSQAGFSFERLPPFRARRGETIDLPIPINPHDSSAEVELTFELPPGITPPATPVRVNPHVMNKVPLTVGTAAIGDFQGLVRGRQRGVDADGGVTEVTAEYQFTISIGATGFDPSYGKEGLFTSEPGQVPFAVAQDVDGHMVVAVRKLENDLASIYRDTNDNGTFEKVFDTADANCVDLIVHPITNRILLLCPEQLSVFDKNGLFLQSWVRMELAPMAFDRLLVLGDGKVLIQGRSVYAREDLVLDHRLSSGSPDPNFEQPHTIAFGPEYDHRYVSTADDRLTIVSITPEHRIALTRHLVDNGGFDRSFNGSGLVLIQSEDFDLGASLPIPSPRELDAGAATLPSFLVYGMIGKLNAPVKPSHVLQGFAWDGSSVFVVSHPISWPLPPLLALDPKRLCVYAGTTLAESPQTVMIAGFNLTDGSMAIPFGNLPEAGLFESDLSDFGQISFMRVEPRDVGGLIVVAIGTDGARWHAARVIP